MMSGEISEVFLEVWLQPFDRITQSVIVDIITMLKRSFTMYPAVTIALNYADLSIRIMEYLELVEILEAVIYFLTVLIILLI